MKRLALILMTCLAALCHADTAAHKLVQLKFADANALRELVASFGVAVKADATLRALVLTGTPEAVAEAEAAIQKLDVRQQWYKNVELLAYMVWASNEPQTTPELPELAPAT